MACCCPAHGDEERPSPPPISKIPREILCRILDYTMASEVPLDLDVFLSLGWRCGIGQFPMSSSWKSWYPEGQYYSQKEHFLDWVSVNGTCRAFRAYGTPAFFAHKIVTITYPLFTSLYQWFLRGSGRSCPNSDNHSNPKHDNGLVSKLHRIQLSRLSRLSKSALAQF